MLSKRILLTSSLLTGYLLSAGLPMAQATSSAPETSVAPIVEPAPPAPAADPLEVPAATETVPEPIAAPAPAAPLSVDSAEAFIDRTDYSLGATQPTPNQSEASGYEPPSEIVIIPGTQNQAPISAGSVQVGSVSLSSAGINWADSASESADTTSAAPSSYSTAMPPSLPYLNPKLFQTFARMGNDNLRLLFPVAIPAPITSLFGWRVHPISGTQRMHTGTDIGAPMGAPVLAALSGRVILADSMGGYGITVAIEHDNGVRQTMYAHLSEIFVKPGDMVQQGSVIGRIGSTGASTGPHLHFEFRQMMPDGTWVALDAGKHLEVAAGDLIKSLQIAQQAPKSIASGQSNANAQKLNR
jgi:murein DD-endopeptidase MepM/ murein hydrolase activator NlpD